MYPNIKVCKNFHATLHSRSQYIRGMIQTQSHPSISHATFAALRKARKLRIAPWPKSMRFLLIHSRTKWLGFFSFSYHTVLLTCETNGRSQPNSFRCATAESMNEIIWAEAAQFGQLQASCLHRHSDTIRSCGLIISHRTFIRSIESIFATIFHFSSMNACSALAKNNEKAARIN